MNYKIEVENKEQADEAQEWFFELGFRKGYCSHCDYPKFIVTEGDYSAGAPLGYFLSHKCEEVSFDQLRALVSLHKNPINMDKVLSEVRSDALGLLEDKPMKEYLIPNDGNYKYQKAYPITAWKKWIEIPEGADYYAKDSSNGFKGEFFFRLRSDGFDYGAVYLEGKWMNAVFSVDGQEVLWQRHTQPEELPFVDDEPSFEKHVKKMKSLMMPCMPKPSLNDQYAEIEQVRQEYNPEDINLATGYDLDELAREYGYRNRDIQESDLCYRESLKIFIKRKPNQTTINAMNEADTLFADAVNHPSHYASGEIECIDAMEAMLTPEQFIGYLRGNAFKYQWRYENKGGITDLEKAQWYLNKLISRIS